MFSAIDADGDGVISARELKRAVVQLKRLDVDKDGSITLAEAGPGLPMGGPVGFGDPAQFVERMMQNDTNGDGRLAADEVPPQLQQMLAAADQNRDGFIDRAELTVATQNMRGRFPGGAGAWTGPPGARGPGEVNEPFDPNQMTGRLMQNDLNGDGRLSADELPPQAVGMLRGGDQNNDGAIDATELRAVMARMGERGRALNADGANPREAERARRRGADSNRPRPRD
jgi:Ca2+-binding EF-hand superfamily protein